MTLPKVASLEAVAQEILAWRGWYLDLDEKGEWWLRSVSMSTRWEGPTLVADKVPEQDSPHGVYALRDRAHVGRQGYMGNCCGEVALSGVVVEGSNGYRAERATIRRLILLGYPLPDVRPIEVMAALEDKYQCEVAWEEPVLAQYDDAFHQRATAMTQQLLSAYGLQSSNGTQYNSGLGYGLSVLGGLGRL